MIEASEKDSSPSLAFMAKEDIVAGARFIFSILACGSVAASCFTCPPGFQWVCGLAAGIVLALLAIAHAIKSEV